jgi:crotonobetainyl-CoA:carnitine CoA-transferase CaiB-like acyl-CoA transferase
LSALEAADVPCGPIRDILEAFASPEAVARGMTVELDHPAWGVIRQVGVPFALSSTPASIRLAPPTLGQDGDAVLTGLGYTPAEIEALRRDGVI